MSYELDRTTLIGNMVGEYGDISYRNGFFYGFTTGILISTLTFLVFHSRCIK